MGEFKPAREILTVKSILLRTDHCSRQYMVTAIGEFNLQVGQPMIGMRMIMNQPKGPLMIEERLEKLINVSYDVIDHVVA